MTGEATPPELFSFLDTLTMGLLARDETTLRQSFRELDEVHRKSEESDELAKVRLDLCAELANRAHDLLTRYLDARDAHTFLEGNAGCVELLLAVSDGPLNQKKLAEKLSMNEGNLSRTLDTLEEMSLIVRLKHDRSNAVLLSPPGVEALLQHEEHCRIGPECPALKAMRVCSDEESVIPKLRRLQITDAPPEFATRRVPVTPSERKAAKFGVTLYGVIGSVDRQSVAAMRRH